MPRWRLFQEAFFHGYGAGKRPSFMSKQLGFQQCLSQGAAVDRHERSGAPRAVRMNSTGDQFLAGAALTLQQYRTFRLGDSGNGFVDGHHGRAASHEIIEPVAAFQLVTQDLVLPGEIFVFQCTAGDKAYLVDDERFAEIIEGACLDAVDGGLQGTVRGHQNHRHVVLLGAQLLEERQPVHVRHMDITHDEVRGALPDLLQSRLWMGCRRNVISFLRQDFMQQRQGLRVIIDDQDVGVFQFHWTFLTSGRKIEKREPLPGSLSTVICPPCARTVSCTMASPNPVPLPIVLVVKNG